MTYKAVVGLQNCKDFLKVVPNSYSETCVTSKVNSQINIKLEGGSDIEVEEDPVDITFRTIKIEQEVSPTYLV
jgi:hypothetical protein